MPDGLEEFIKDTAKGVGYFRKLKEKKSPQAERMEQAVEEKKVEEKKVGIEGKTVGSQKEVVVPKTQPQVRVEKPTLGEDVKKFLEEGKKLLKKSTGGSRPFSEEEIMKGYRRL